MASHFSFWHRCGNTDGDSIICHFNCVAGNGLGLYLYGHYGFRKWSLFLWCQCHSGHYGHCRQHSDSAAYAPGTTHTQAFLYRFELSLIGGFRILFPVHLSFCFFVFQILAQIHACSAERHPQCTLAATHLLGGIFVAELLGAA